MTAPRTSIARMDYRNPHASMPLTLPVLVVCNTSDDNLRRNIRANAALDLPWIGMRKSHDRRAVLVGGGPSVADDVETILKLKNAGAAVFAMNGAARWLREAAGILADYQVIADAKPETAQLVDLEARGYLFASQVDIATMAEAKRERVTLWHLGIDGMEEWFPQERRKRGGYALVGGGAAVGNSALCLAYVMGYRDLHAFGYDSCHRAGASHAYPQQMNQFIPCTTVEWGGRAFTASVAMKAQAEKFQITAQMLKKEGCAITVYGDGLLQTMYRTPASDLAEADKYRRLWQCDAYRTVSPGEEVASDFLARVNPPSGSAIIDFGCGTGRASLVFARAGLSPTLIDFADNCRDEEAIGLPFFEWDLTHPCPLRAPYGFCADVMEHIPTETVETVVSNIVEAAGATLFQIATVDDVFGEVIGCRLHNTVKPHSWWRQIMSRHGDVTWEREDEVHSSFLVARRPAT